MEDPEEKRRVRQLKILLVLGEHDGERKDSLKFLSQFHEYHEEHGDRYVPPALREAVARNEANLGIAATEFAKPPHDDDWLKEPIQYRDNNRRQMREFFDDNYKIWLPLCDYEIREYWAQNYCGCSRCMWKSALRDNKKHGCSNDQIGPCPAVNDSCTKTKFYLPYGERDDDCGVMDYEG